MGTGPISKEIDLNMTAICHDPSNTRHYAPGHPERPERYTAIIQALEGAGLMKELPRVPVRQATEQEFLAVHERPMIARIEETVKRGGGMLDPDTYCTPESWGIARDAAGGLIDLCCAVARGEHPNGLALPRPPGHHATAQVSMGFCLINHAAVAARALQDLGLAKKVAIVDFDVHHGNGTEDIFTADPTVFYASTHQFPHYPGTGRASDRGHGPGHGFTLNLPFPAGAGDTELIPAYADSIVPALTLFAPDFLIVSAGYDAHRDDPLAGLNVSSAGFAEISRLLVEAAANLCGGKVVFTLEGGYNLDVLGECLVDTARILMGAAGADS
jgi:acetoin utilization deacetylase AcuC-like enzyme